MKTCRSLFERSDKLIDRKNSTITAPQILDLCENLEPDSFFATLSTPGVYLISFSDDVATPYPTFQFSGITGVLGITWYCGFQDISGFHYR